MAEPVDIDPIDHDEIGEEDDNWDDNLMNDSERRFEELRHFNIHTGCLKNINNFNDL